MAVARRARVRRRRVKTLQIALILALLAAGGCARAPSANSAGPRLVVTLRFAGPINDLYHYFFLIRNANDLSNQNWPVPIVAPPYLNGFATGKVQFSSTTDPNYTAGFTDFVEYGRAQLQVNPSGYTLYHIANGIKGDPNDPSQFRVIGDVDFGQPANGGAVLRFDLSLSRLRPPAGEIDPNNGSLPRYLQVNMVATTTTPHSPTAVDDNKILDAFGDQRDLTANFNAFQLIDTTQTGRVYQSSADPANPTYEPDNDEYSPAGKSDPGVELLSWSVQVVGQ